MADLDRILRDKLEAVAGMYGLTVERLRETGVKRKIVAEEREKSVPVLIRIAEKL